MTTAFVTGGSGFVGRRLITHLREQDILVRALARSDAATHTVQALGATAVYGDLDNAEALARGMAGCELVFHAAALVAEWGDRDDYERVNVAGTRRVTDAARAAGVRRLIHVSSEAVYADGGHLENIDENRPRPANPLPRYPRSKARAESLVEAANGAGLETVSVRPTTVWGAGDTSVLPKIAQAVASGRFMWISGGRYRRATTHVDNLCEALLLAAAHGRPGETYFVTDGEPVIYREFLTAALATLGVAPPSRSVPRPLAWAAAQCCDALWDGLRLTGPPPVSRLMVALFGSSVTVDDGKARRELGYIGGICHGAGLAAMQQDSATNLG